MNNKYQISVVIPVYNAISFIEEAVLSALNFDLVGEILLIDDGSNDGSLTKCEELQFTFSKVRCLRHTNGINKGVSASRNLGILSARFPYIAFLDADDYFLSNKFDSFNFFINEGLDFDGIYEPVQYFNGKDKIYGIKIQIESSRLFYYLIRGTFGHIHTNGVIVKKDLLQKAGLFVDTLYLHQDSDLWLKLAFYGKLMPGKAFYPVAKVRIHDGNRIWKGISNKSRYQQWFVTWNWAKKEQIGKINKLLILYKLLSLRIKILIKNAKLSH